MEVKFALNFSLGIDHVSNGLALRYDRLEGENTMGADDAYLSNIVNKIKARDLKQSEDFQRAKHNSQLKREKGEIVFNNLRIWLKETVGRISGEVGRPVIKYRDEQGDYALRLAGEGGDNVYVTVTLEADGSIKYKSALVPEGEGRFVASIENGGDVIYQDKNGILIAQDMGKALIAIVT